jgi:PAS domain S-box-containing protein
MQKRSVVELEDLRNRLREAEETLSAIRNGEVDSLIVTGPNGDQVFSLRGAEQPYRVFVEQMFEGAVTLTTSGTVLYSNRRFADMMRTPLEKVIGGQIQTFIRPQDKQQLDDLLSDPEGKKARLTLTAADQSLVPAQLALSRMPVGEVGAICLVVTDMTEQEEKRELTVALERLKAAQEQLKRQNEELKAARAVAEAASIAKDNFLASLSHELRTPLAPVMMTVTAMERSNALPAEARASLEMIRRNVELEARLIDDLLDITRIVRGKIDLQLQPLDGHTALAKAVEICINDVRAKGLELVEAFGAVRTNITGDPVRVQQILWNLLRNAIKFTPEGGRIVVATDNDAQNLRISIVDSGIGIEPAALDKIFNPFEQADRGITRQFGGLGLGLAISRRLAELHGGTVTASSSGPGQGANFTLILPTVSAPMSSSDASRRPGESDSTRLRILLVEDHRDTREVLCHILRKRHHVHDVENVAAALKAASQEQYDLVISDLGLPDGTGFDLMRALRQSQPLRGICLSGYGMEHDVRRSREAGFDTHLTKPVDLDKLESVVESFVR